MKKFFTVLFVCLLIPWYAHAGDYTRHSATDIRQTTSDSAASRDALRITDTTGTKYFGIDYTGKPDMSWKASIDYANVDHTSNSGGTAYTISSSYDTIYLIDDAPSYGMGSAGLTTGVSFYLPAGSATLDGYQVKVVHASSGTTDICLVPANDAVRGSGVTDHIVCSSGTTYSTSTADVFVYNIADAQWESVTLVYRWVSGMSGGTWYQLDAK